MFQKNGVIFRSTLLDLPGICHGFSTREGGVSTHPYTREMNLAMGREDDDDTVRRNGEIFASLVSDGRMHKENLVTASQIHSDIVRILTAENRGEGMTVPAGEDCDGFVTDVPGVLPVIRVADCTPVLLAGRKSDGSPVVGAVHAGWRGSGAGIVRTAVEKMRDLGVLTESVHAAIGPHIGVCCYEVGEDLLEAVTDMAGEAFAKACCRPRWIDDAGRQKYTADLTGMNLHWLREAGVPAEQIDVSPHCTMCDPAVFHSHRATGGKRGAMGAVIGIYL
ncbi:MAG: peptidoglycan editing factor PgeF [Ruminococcaceae bacterium]|nr:peptidoglycan editing factor PgeF [Oscillospiraceae bacterium]